MSDDGVVRDDGPGLDDLERRLAELEAIDGLRQMGGMGEAIANVTASVRSMHAMLAPHITVEQPPAVVVPAAEVRVDAVDYTALLVALAAKLDEMVAVLAAVAPPVVNVSVPEQPAPVVNVTVAEPGGRRVTFKRDKDGRISSAVVTDG